MKRLMVIGSGWEQERLVRMAKESGCWVLATAWPSTYSDSLSLADHGEIVNPRDLPAMWALAQRHSIDAVISDQCDYSYYATAYIAERLGFPGPTIAAADVATNKYHQRQRLEKSGVPQPTYKLCTTLKEARKALEEIGYPVIFKPLDNRGNFGINRVDSPDSLPNAFYEAVANSHSRKILVEKFIEGVMSTVEGFMFPDGNHISLVTSSKVMLGGHKRVAMELRYPAEFSPEVIQRLLETNQMAMKNLGYIVGPTHAEYMVTPMGDPYFIEAANRGGGVLINSHIVPTLTGIDTTALMLDYALGNPISLREQSRISSCAVLSFFCFNQEGKITAIKGVEEACAIPGILVFRILVKEGTFINQITTDANRHGFVIAQDSNLSSTLALIKKAKEMVEVKCQ